MGVALRLAPALIHAGIDTICDYFKGNIAQVSREMQNIVETMQRCLSAWLMLAERFLAQSYPLGMRE